MARGRRRLRQCRLPQNLLHSHTIGDTGNCVLDTNESVSIHNISAVGSYAALEISNETMQHAENIEHCHESDSEIDWRVLDPLMPRCRFNPAHRVHLRNLKKHEVRFTLLHV